MDDQATAREEQQEKEDRRSRRRKLLALLGRIRQRVNQVCGVVDDANTLIERAEEISKDIRSAIESPQFNSFLPAVAKSGLSTVAGQLERVEDLLEDVGDKARIPKDVCSRVNEVLDLSEKALDPDSTWNQIADSVADLVSSLPVSRRVVAATGTAVLIVFAAIGLYSLIGGGGGGDGGVAAPGGAVFGVYMLPPSLTLEVGDSIPLGVRVEAEGGEDVSDSVDVLWSVDDDTVGSISPDGTLNGLAPGVVGVTVQAAGLSDYREFTVAAPPLPDLVVELNERVAISCVRTICTHTATVLVRNDGDAPAPSSLVTVELNGAMSASAPTPALDPGASADVPVVLDPGDSCYNPDCTAVAVVDREEAMDESNESNNTAEAFFGG